MTYQPLEVTALLPHGIALANPWGVSLDGLLAAALWQRLKNATAATTPLLHQYDPRDPNHSPPDLDLPLARCELAETWHWACTFSTHPTYTAEPDVRLRTRRTDHTSLLRLSPEVSSNVSDTRGRYRFRTTPAIVTVTDSARWTAVGDLDQVRELLSAIPAIGKHRNVGEGQVAAWKVVTIDLDEWAASHTAGSDRLCRITPRTCLNGRTCVHGGEAVASVRAPYAHPSRETAAYLPAP